jgi:hypothetical protein
MVEDHDAEGESLKDVEELEFREVVVGRQVKRGYEFVLQKLIVSVSLIET